MKRQLAAAAIVFLFSLQALFAVVPEKWEFYRYEDFLKGKFDGISVSYDGVLSLAPLEKKVPAPGEEFYLAVYFDLSGGIFLGTGHSGKIYKIDKAGKAELYYHVPEMDVTCLVKDSQGDLYAGTSPNGKIYKITAKDKGSVFFDPAEKYIWDLMFTGSGSLLAAVGEHGGIYEINPEGQGLSILKAQENHILCLYRGRNGDLLAGSGGQGHLYRISKKGKASIVFASPFEEIKSIVQDRKGRIYVAAGGVVPKAGTSLLSSPPAQTSTNVAITVTPAAVPTSGILPAKKKQPGALYRVDDSGRSKKLWASGDEMIYSLLWNQSKNRVLFGTGPHGRIYSVDQNDKISLLFQKDSEQIYQLAAHDSKIYILANNPSLMSFFQSGQRFKGEYTSRVLDASMVSSWGYMNWDAEMPRDTSLQFYTRSGNTQQANKTWSEWSPPYQKGDGEPVLSPRTRFLQFKIVFKTQSGRKTPLVRKVSLFHQEINMEPEISSLKLLPPNVVFIKPFKQEDVVWGADQKTTSEKEGKSGAQAVIMPKKQRKKGYQTIVWQAADRNADGLAYSLFIRKADSQKWRLLKNKCTDSIFALETATLPDGVYFIKVVASDSPSNPAGTELAAEKISRALIIDNTPPFIQNMQVSRDKNKIKISFIAGDSLSSIKEARYFVRPGEWMTVFPKDGICDSRRESFEWTVKLPANADDMITVKVVDRHGNTAVARKTF